MAYGSVADCTLLSMRILRGLFIALLVPLLLCGCLGKQPAENRISGPEEARTRGHHIPPRVTKDTQPEAGNIPPTVQGSFKTIVLALPLSGQYTSMGAKIFKGAQIAQEEMLQRGSSHTLLVVDTNQEGWADKIAAMPAETSIVGGPLLMREYTTAKTKGLLSNRAFFCFLPRVDEGDEGRTAWRFFPSPRDQVSALIRFTQSLGIQRYGALYPDDAASGRIVDIFAAQAQAMGGELTKRTTYSYANSAEWTRITASFLGTSKNAVSAANPSFQAIFLPDVWKNMESLVPNFFYYRETGQILLGTTLWEQGLVAGIKEVPARYFERAVFPGVWQPNRPSLAVESLQAAMSRSGETVDFWVALGYDFMRLATHLTVPVGWNAQQLNTQLAALGDFPFSLAPMHWSHTGVATQDLFLFTPTATGFVPVNVETFRSISPSP